MGFFHERQMTGLVRDSSQKNSILHLSLFLFTLSPLFAAVQYDGNKQEVALGAELCEQQSVSVNKCLNDLAECPVSANGEYYSF